MATPSSAVMASIRTIWRWRYSPTRVFDRQPTTAQSPTSPISTVEPPPEWTSGFEPSASRARPDSRLPPLPIST